ncbi:hypothetical protein HYU14_04370 [Candidatus Woesearchaeota archaeon]|nr:hypothetical protein [Candidatus Woesearchaeota archaeon]
MPTTIYDGARGSGSSGIRIYEEDGKIHFDYGAFFDAAEFDHAHASFEPEAFLSGIESLVSGKEAKVEGEGTMKLTPTDDGGLMMAVQPPATLNQYNFVFASGAEVPSCFGKEGLDRIRRILHREK